jgi:hypothetical protein
VAREIVMGNGRLSAALDGNISIRDFYYPSAGLENHLSGHGCRIGKWPSGKFRWLSNGWARAIGYLLIRE